MRDAITKKRLTRLLLSMPTGSGKGRVAQAIVNNSAGTVWFVAPRLEILDQLSRHLTELNIAHGILRAGHGHDTTALRVQVASMLTIRRRTGLTPPDIIIVDEAHLFYDAIVELRDRFPNAIIIGMTATPCRLDGRGLGGVFETLIQTTSVGELIADGHLVPFRALAPPAPDMSSISTVAGEYHRGQAASVFGRPAVIGDAVGHWQRHAAGRPTVVFCVDVEHSKQTVAQYLAAGVRAVHIDAETPLKVRRNTIDAFRAGDIEVVCNVELLTYGVDIPVIGCVQMLRPTKSLALLLQMLGRGLRPYCPACAGATAACEHPQHKRCIAEGELVLTDAGLIPIEKVPTSARVWDGVEWVSHDGPVCQGVRSVIEYAGLSATPDHHVATAFGWKTFGECAEEKMAIVQTGIGGRPVRKRDGHFSGNQTSRTRSQGICPGPMRNLRTRVVDFIQQRLPRTFRRVPIVQSAVTSPEMADRTISPGAATLRKRIRRCLQILRSARDSIRFQFGTSGRPLGTRKPWLDEAYATGQDREQRPLRSRQLAVGYETAEYAKHSQEKGNGSRPRIQNVASRGQVFRLDAMQHDLEGTVQERDRKAMGSSVSKTKRRVWDLLNAGPRNRFTVSGLLVHNCLVILDHANNIRSHDVLPDTPIAWTLDGIDRRRADAPTISVRTCEKCYAAYRATESACPRCGHVNAPPAERAGVKTKDGTLEELSGSQLYGRQAGAEEAVRLLAKWGGLAGIRKWKHGAAHARFRGMFGRWPTLQEELAASVLRFPAYLVPGGKCKVCACAGTTPGYKLGGPGGGSDNVAQIRCEGCNRWLAWVPKEFVSLLPVLGS